MIPPSSGPTHTVVQKAKVRSGPSPSSRAVGFMVPGQHVGVLETMKKDGHLRARVGPGEWISERTAMGSTLLAPYAPHAQPYTVVATATVRKKMSTKSKWIREIEAGTTVVVLEEAHTDGHHRGKIGVDEWMSLRTAKGSLLATPAGVAAASVSAVAVSAVMPADVEMVQPAVVHAGSLGQPALAAAPTPGGAQLGTQYTIVAKATVRMGMATGSTAVRELQPRTEIVVLEQGLADGHQRGRIGDNQWISLRTVRSSASGRQRQRHASFDECSCDRRRARFSLCRARSPRRGSRRPWQERSQRCRRCRQCRRRLM